MGRRAWIGWLLLGAVACGSYPFMPAESLASSVVYVGVGLGSFVAIVWGVRRNRPAGARAWYVFAAGIGVFVVGDIVYEGSGHLLGMHPSPGWDDVLYFVAYPMLLGGLLFAVRGRRDAAGLIDPAVIALAVGFVFWVLTISPALHNSDLPLPERLINAGYPIWDIFLCAVATRLLTRSGRRSVSLMFLAGGAAVTLGSDVIWTLLSAYSSYDGTVFNIGFLIGYVCWGAGALHPSMRGGSVAPLQSADRFGPGRFVLLAGATLLVPTVQLIQGGVGRRVDWAAASLVTAALFLLLLARIAAFAGHTDRQSAQLAALAIRDELTGLPNRRRFVQALGAALQAGNAQVSVLDVDDIHGVNDRFGDAIGDRLIVAVAGRLAQDGRFVARMGADEFAILLPGATPADGDALVARIRAAFDEPFDVGGYRFLITVSIGVADAGGTVHAAEALRLADVAMRAAKAGGTVSCRYHVDLDRQAGKDAVLGGEIRAGLVAGQFRLVYQPIVDLPDGRLRYVEALVRWHHPDRGVVSPADFIPAAEQNGLIVELGAWVLRTACRQFARWHEVHGAPERISVNVSARQLAQPGFADVVAGILAETGVAPADLIVEVTETAVFGGGVAMQAVADLHRLGTKIALDDFGTGHSSLGLLQTVPVDVLKVDKSFVDNLTMAGRHAVIADALIHVSNGLGLVAVAEGVETADQAAELYRLGYRLAQGYHFGRPVPEPDFADVAVRARTAGRR